jgi:hypothetical protein
MPVVVLNLTSFSFKRKHEDWIGPLDVSIEDQDSCVILTGINAGGKSLTLKSLEKFTKLLTDPNKSNKIDFENFVKVSGIDEISARYDFKIPNESDVIQIEIDNRDTFIKNHGGNFEGLSEIDLEEEILGWEVTQSIETKFSYKNEVFSYTRRHGSRLRVVFDFESIDDLAFSEVNEECFSKWEDVFDDMSQLPRERMFSYGDWSTQTQLSEKTGLEIDFDRAESYEWWDKENSFHFVAKKTIMLQIDDAYQISDLTLERLRPFNERANAKREGKKWINERLKKAYKECHEHYFSSGMDDKNKVKFAAFLYPSRKLREASNSLEQDIVWFGTNKSPYDLEKFLDWVSDPPVPNTEMLIPKSERKDSTSLVEDVFPNDLEGICLRLIKYCPNLIYEYDPDLFFWIVVSDCIDYPNNPSLTYYSSGQRRMISIIEEIMKNDSRDVILIDEPELSLHIDWQRRFIEKVSALGKKLVIATHSPDIIYHHTEKVVEVPPSKEI